MELFRNKEEALILPFVATDISPAMQIGIFGIDLLDPRSAARRAQFVQCEKLLETSPDAVKEALETGSVSAPNVLPSLQTLQDEAHRLKPMLVVPISAINK